MKIQKKIDLLTGYNEILKKGCLTDHQREQFKNGKDISDVIVHVSSGSSGANPLCIPRTNNENSWITTKLFQRFQHFKSLNVESPLKVALLGGITHMAAGQKVKVEGVFTRNFSGNDLRELDEFDPHVLSMYPSFSREIVANQSIKLNSLRGIKLGGEPIFPIDIKNIFSRFPEITVVEQFGSTEMMGVFFRTYTKDNDSGYILSDDRYDYKFQDTDDWQPLIVCDNLNERAFPIEGWFEMDDEVVIIKGSPIKFRRQNDKSFPLWSHIEKLFEQGCSNVQLHLIERIVYYNSISILPEKVDINGHEYKTVKKMPYRLKDSNKLPLVIDSSIIDMNS